MKPIKKIAGELLLYLYSIQRNDASLLLEILSFNRDRDGKINLSEGSKLVENILKITNKSSIDVFNALNYLSGKYFISFSYSENTGGYLFNSIRVTSNGTDIIEGIERGPKEKKEFNINFNIKLADNINVESLLKAELGSLFKAALI